MATALVAWLRARAAGGALILRVEDIDTPRVLPDSEARQIADLHWLGLDWDEGPNIGGPHAPYRQSERTALYEAAIHHLSAQGLVYLCDCSRRELRSASVLGTAPVGRYAVASQALISPTTSPPSRGFGIASAPHAGEEEPRYPGTCRPHGMRSRRWKRPPAVRVALPDREVVVNDAFQGMFRQHVERTVGDFVLKRGDGVYAYQLAVVVDDLAMGITEVVRGADLLNSAPRQTLLAEMLGGPAPAFAHVPLIVGADGGRIEKRNPCHTLHGLRALGMSPGVFAAEIARTLRIVDPACGSLDLATASRDSFDLAALRGCRELRLRM